MARYIKREDLDFLNDFKIDSGKYIGLRLDDVFDILVTDDAVEREEYEKIKFERDMSVQQIHDLGNSVSKAIEEMERDSTRYEHIERHDLADVVDSCIGTILKYIGEQL